MGLALGRLARDVRAAPVSSTGLCTTLWTGGRIPAPPEPHGGSAEDVGVQQVGRPEDDEITGPHAKPRSKDPVRDWLDRHDRIIGPALLQFWLRCMLSGPAYLLYTHIFG